MDKKIKEVEFVIFDTETTGLDPSTEDRIVEIAAMRFKGKDSLGRFHSLVNPGREISPRAFEVNPVRELRSLTVYADGGIKPPSAL